MVIKNVESLKDLEIIEFLNTVVSKFGRRFLFIFEKRTPLEILLQLMMYKIFGFQGG